MAKETAKHVLLHFRFFFSLRFTFWYSLDIPCCGLCKCTHFSIVSFAHDKTIAISFDVQFASITIPSIIQRDQKIKNTKYKWKWKRKTTTMDSMYSFRQVNYWASGKCYGKNKTICEIQKKKKIVRFTKVFFCLYHVPILFLGNSNNVKQKLNIFINKNEFLVKKYIRNFHFAFYFASKSIIFVVIMVYIIVWASVCDKSSNRVIMPGTKLTVDAAWISLFFYLVSLGVKNKLKIETRENLPIII